MYLSKYPVISSSGNEYKVDVFDAGYGFIRVALYKYIGISRFLKREKYELLYGGSLTDRHYDPDKYNHDYVEIAKTQVAHYEEMLELQRKRKDNHERNLKKFYDWDGKC